MKKLTCQKCSVEFEFEPFEGCSLFFTPKLCPPCQDVQNSEYQIEKDRLCAAERLDRLKHEWRMICPPLYRVTDIAQIPVERLSSVMGWKDGSRGLLVEGSTGTQKTRCVYHLLRQLHFESGKKIIALSSHDFSRECALRFGDNVGEEWIKKLIDTDIVFFDDLGKFKMTERIESELFGVIDGRIANLRPIFATTNFGGSTFAQKLSPDRGIPIVRRLREFCELVSFSEGNNRFEKLPSHEAAEVEEKAAAAKDKTDQTRMYKPKMDLNL